MKHHYCPITNNQPQGRPSWAGNGGSMI